MAKASKHGALSAEKSVRLTHAQEDLLLRAAALLGVKQSDFIREAILSRCASVLAQHGNLQDDFPDIIGVVGSDRAPGARNVKDVFAADQAERLQRRRNLQ